ncbi:MAG: DUF4058 family protein [Isosphaeraceae bacterium]
MAGPFPGMDPYLEFQSAWPDFHNRLVAGICNELGSRLPLSYVARVVERIEVVFPDPVAPSSFRPDVLLARPPGLAERQAESQGVLATVAIEPRVMEVVDRDPEEMRLTCVEVRSLPELDLVTAIEVLSPVNKGHPGRPAYLNKRESLHSARVNLVEIDLLLGGAPLPMKELIPSGGYYAVVARGSRLPRAEVYWWGVRDRLPSLPIPLREPDGDVWIDLGELVGRVYELGRYDRTLKRDQPLPESALLTPDDRAWAVAAGAASAR